MNVLSLFDGMSCGQIALRELGLIPERYYASEIDKFAIAQTQLNFPDTVQLGDVTKWKEWNIDWKSIDLVLAGSPCQGFSFAGKQLAFDDPRSKLFFVFIDILNHIKSVNSDVLFLLENVNMKRSYMQIISEYCGVFPVNINSNLVSAQNRNRWYWTNIRTRQIGLFGEVHSDIPQPEDRGIYLRDILEDEVDEKYYVSQKALDRAIRRNYSKPVINPEKSGTLNTKNNSGQVSFDSGTTFISVDSKAPTQRCATGLSLDKKHNYQFICVAMRGREYEEANESSKVRNIQQLEPRYDGKTNCLTSVEKDNLLCSSERIRRLTTTECARLQTVPDWYKWACSETQQYKMLGNGWTVEVIKHILKYL